jgi:hypothetical protein
LASCPRGEIQTKVFQNKVLRRIFELQGSGTKRRVEKIA